MAVTQVQATADKTDGTVRRSATMPTSAAWIPIAAVLLGSGWGSNQFTPMLLVYHHSLGLGTGSLEAMFGFYALGLIPGLFMAGALADAHGRRPVVFGAAVLSLVASIALAAADASVAILFVGRLLAGLGSGAAFSAGTAWLREVSRPPYGTASDHDTARRAAVAMTVGFAVGPLVSGVIAQWAPSPAVLPYVPHIVLMVAVLAALRGSPETLVQRSSGALRKALPVLRGRRFRRLVAPMAPWVFAAPAIAFALLPSVVGADHATDGIALTALITAVTALAGVVVQPLARRLDAAPHGHRAARVGLAVMVLGMALAAVTAYEQQIWLLIPTAIVLGCAFGLCLVAGLVEVQRLADPRTLAGLTAIYYALTYVGFAAPFVLTLAAHALSYTALLAICAGLALATLVLVVRGAQGA